MQHSANTSSLCTEIWFSWNITCSFHLFYSRSLCFLHWPYDGGVVEIWPWPAIKGSCRHSIAPPPAGVGRRMETKGQNSCVGQVESSLTEQQMKQTVATTKLIWRIYTKQTVKCTQQLSLPGALRAPSSSGNTLNSLPSGQSMITSRIPGQQGFPIWACCVISTTHSLHVASVVWCVEGTLSLNIQPRTGNRGARRSCASVSTTSKAARTPSYAAKTSFSVGV